METRLALRSLRTTLSAFALRTDEFLDLQRPQIRVEGVLALEVPLRRAGDLGEAVQAAVARQAGVELADVAICGSQCHAVTGVWTAVMHQHVFFTVSVPLVTRAHRVEELLADCAALSEAAEHRFTVHTTECSIVLNDTAEPLPPMALRLQPMRLLRPLVPHALLALAAVAGVACVGWPDYQRDRACPVSAAAAVLVGEPVSLSLSGPCASEDALYKVYFDCWARSIVTGTDSLAVIAGCLPIALLGPSVWAAVVAPPVALLYCVGMTLARLGEACLARSPAAAALERRGLELNRLASLPEAVLVRTGELYCGVLKAVVPLLECGNNAPRGGAVYPTLGAELRSLWPQWYRHAFAAVLHGAAGAALWAVLFRYACAGLGLGQALHWLLAKGLQVLGDDRWLTAQAAWLKAEAPPATTAQHRAVAGAFALLLLWLALPALGGWWAALRGRPEPQTNPLLPSRYGTFHPHDATGIQ